MLLYFNCLFIGKLPSFSLIEERTDREGVPLVGIAFADGSSDTLVLWKYDNNLEGSFIGHLANEPDACVAMVNHPEHAEFTIMSDRVAESGSTMYKWKNTGEVELIPELLSNGRKTEVVRKSDLDDDDKYNDEMFESPTKKRQLFKEDDDILLNMSPLEANEVPKTGLLQIKVLKL